MTKEGFEPWPDLMTPQNMSKLFDLYPESKLLQLYAFPKDSNERKLAWEDLGVTDPIKQQALETELENLISSLADKWSNVKFTTEIGLPDCML